MDFDLGDLAQLEESLYKVGHADGFEHGRIHGLIEGRALGREKGFEMWEELGFYEGFATLWLRPPVRASGNIDDRTIRHAEQLLSLIAKFPMTNPSTAIEEGSQIDIVRLFTQIRSKYKVLCSTLGVRPRLVAAGAVSSDPSIDGLADDPDMQRSEPIRPGRTTHPTPQSLSF
ncbi:hypothetical protein FRC12_008516 [Ceratobasidium sp. 428]|nr:hypothetical protein FRC12_008516 [Ceratobasidium sp. 428]